MSELKRVRLLKRKDGYNSEPLLTMVEYGDREHGPLKKYVAKFTVGQIEEVQSEIAYALVGRYGGLFEIIPDGVREPRPDGVRVTKEVK